MLLSLSKLNISQNQLGRDIGMSQSGINYYVSGKHSPSADAFLRICNRLNLNPNKYFGETSSWDNIFQKYSSEAKGDSVIEYLSKNYYTPIAK